MYCDPYNLVLQFSSLRVIMKAFNIPPQAKRMLLVRLKIVAGTTCVVHCYDVIRIMIDSFIFTITVM